MRSTAQVRNLCYRGFYLFGTSIAAGMFELALDGVAERGAYGAIDDAVVERKRQIHQVGRLESSFVIVHRPLDDLAHAHDANFRMVDDRRRNQSADATDRRDRERTSFQILATSPPGLAIGAESFDFGCHREHVLLIDVANDGNDQPGRRRDRDADVVFVVQNDVARVLVERAIDDRNLFECLGQSLHEERQIGKLDAVAGTRLAHAVAEANQIGDVAFVDIRVVRNAAL